MAVIEALALRPTGPATLDAFRRLVHHVYPDAELIRAWPLNGGISAQVTALEILHGDGRTQKMTVRQHGPNDLGRNPKIAADEFRLLQRLHLAGLPVPRPYHADESGEFFPTPCIVVEYIEGATDLAPREPTLFTRQFAEQLVRIHGLDASGLIFLPNEDKRIAGWIANRPTEPDESLNEGRIRAILQSAWPLPHPNAPALLHGDYWPGNVLWRNGELVGIIDWEDAALGDPLSDLASSRLEIFWACGAEAMEQYTEYYRSLTSSDLSDLPYWDLYRGLRSATAISGWGLEKEAERKMREQYLVFISNAFEQLSGI